MVTRFENSEILLRKLRVSDLFEVYKNIKDKQVGKWTGPPRKKWVENPVGRFICRMSEHTLKGGKMIWYSLFKPEVQTSFRLGIVLKETNKVIGIVSLTKELPDDDFADIGFWIGRRYWGRGLMSEVLPLAVRYGFEELGLDKIKAWTFEENVASKKVMEKCGFKKECVHKNAYIKYGRSQNRIDYVICK